MADAPQSFQSHTKWDPLFHFILAPLFLLNVIFHGAELVHTVMHGASWIRPGWSFIFSIALFLLTFKVRLYALKVQDRLIRLEERLRLQAVLPEPLRARISELSVSQLIALRFAPDAELPALVQAALDNRLDMKQIKQGIRTWRADDFRA